MASSRYNLNSGIGNALKLPWIAGKYFFVTLPALSSHRFTSDMWNITDAEGRNRISYSIDAAINKCVANRGDVIVISPNYYETITADNLITLDVAGITLLGLGNGQDRPEIRFSGDETKYLDCSADNLKLKNIILTCNIANQTRMIYLVGSGFQMEDCEVREGTGTPIKMLDLTGVSANDTDDAFIKNNYFYCPTAGNGDSAIELGEVADSVKIIGNEIFGDFDDAGIHNPTGKVLTNLLLEGNKVSNTQSGQHAIELVSACTGMAVNNRLYSDARATMFDPGSLICVGNLGSDTIDEAGVPIPDTADTADNYIGKNTADNEVSTANVVSNADGSVLERLEDLKTSLGDTQGLSYQGTCDVGMVGSLSVIVCAELAGYGDDFFNSKYYVQVIKNANAVGASPELEVRQVLDYVSSTGTFTTSNFGNNVEAGDEILVLHESIVMIGNNSADNPATTNLVASNADGSILERQEFSQVTLGAGTDAAVASGLAGSVHGHIRAAQEILFALTTDVGDASAGTLGSIYGILGNPAASLATQMGTNADASTDPSLASGTLFSKVRGIGDDTDSLLADTGDGADLAVTAGLAGSIHAHVRDVQNGVDLLEADVGDASAGTLGSLYAILGNPAVSLAGQMGTNADVATDPSVASGTLFSKLRGIGNDTDALSADMGDASASTLGSVYGILGNPAASISTQMGTNADASTDPSVASGTLFSKLRGIGDDLDAIGLAVGTGTGGTADAGSGVATLVDAALVQGNDYWNGARLVMTSGLNNGLARYISDFDAATDTATVYPAFPGAIGAGDTYEIIPDDGINRLGDNQEAATDPSATTGTLFSKLRGAGNDLDSILTDTGDGTDVAVTAGLAGSLHAHVRDVQDGVDLLEADVGNASAGTLGSLYGILGNPAASLATQMGTNAEAATDPSVASGTLFSKLRGAGDDLDSVLADTGDGTDVAVTAGLAGSLHAHVRDVQNGVDLLEADLGDASVGTLGSIYGILGNPAASISGQMGTNADAASDPSAATGTLFSKIRGAGDDLDSLLADTGDGTDVAVTAGLAGSLHAHVRDVQAGVDLLEADLGDASAGTLGSVYGILGNPAVSLAGQMGTNADASTEPSVASGTIFSKLRGIGDEMKGSALHNGSANYLSVSVDFTNATWNTVATHELFTVTGLVRVRMLAEVTETLVDAGDLATIQLGFEGATNELIAATGAAGLAGDTLSTGEIWIDATPADTRATLANAIFDRVVSGSDIGYEIAGQVLTDGTIVFHLWWEALSSGATVVAGAGGVL